VWLSDRGSPGMYKALGSILHDEIYFFGHKCLASKRSKGQSASDDPLMSTLLPMPRSWTLSFLLIQISSSVNEEQFKRHFCCGVAAILQVEINHPILPNSLHF
jgi:hypothetical protein